MLNDLVNWRPVLPVADLEEGRPRRVLVEDRILLLVRRGDVVHAVDGVCPHKFGPLEDGEVEGGRITCPLHEAVFDLATGEPEAGQEWAGRLNVYPTRVQGGVVEVQA